MIGLEPEDVRNKSGRFQEIPPNGFVVSIYSETCFLTLELNSFD